jgi:hypothetical protein
MTNLNTAKSGTQKTTLWIATNVDKASEAKRSELEGQFKAMSDEDRVQFLQKLNSYRHSKDNLDWYQDEIAKASDPARIAELKSQDMYRQSKECYENLVSILGEKRAVKVSNTGSMYSLTVDQKQFRCWYGTMGRFHEDGTYVDSAGEGLYWSVNGENLGDRGICDWVNERYEAIRHQTGVIIWINGIGGRGNRLVGKCIR